MIWIYFEIAYDLVEIRMILKSLFTSGTIYIHCYIYTVGTCLEKNKYTNFPGLQVQQYFSGTKDNGPWFLVFSIITRHII